jgi:type II secretory pathway component PulF
MSTFTFRAVDEEANIRNGILDAADESELERKLGAEGLTLIEAAKRGRFSELFSVRQRFSSQDLLSFSYLLSLIVSSGMSLISGLSDLSNHLQNRKISYAAGLLGSRLEAGMSLSDAMQESPRLFPEYYVQMIRAGEASGSLDRNIEYLMGYMDWQISFRKTIKSYLAYPAMVMGTMAILLVILFTFVFPKLVSILVGLKTELPLPTRVVISAVSFFRDYILFLAAGIAAAVAAFRFWVRTSRGRRVLDSFILSIPLIGMLVTKIDLSRYFKTLAALYSSGINMEKTLTIAADVVHNRVLAASLALVTDSVMTGESIAQGMIRAKVFSSFVTEMVSVGEKTGNLDSALLRAGAIFDREVPETIKKVFSFVEPLTIIFLGAIVLVVLLSIFLPIYRIVGSVRMR